MAEDNKPDAQEPQRPPERCPTCQNKGETVTACSDSWHLTNSPWIETISNAPLTTTLTYEEPALSAQEWARKVMSEQFQCWDKNCSGCQEDEKSFARALTDFAREATPGQGERGHNYHPEYVEAVGRVSELEAELAALRTGDIQRAKDITRLTIERDQAREDLAALRSALKSACFDLASEFNPKWELGDPKLQALADTLEKEYVS